jgi:hypothetical protein
MTIVITPEVTRPFAAFGEKPEVIVGKRYISFNPSAVRLLALGVGDRFSLEIDDRNKLYIRLGTEDGYLLEKETKRGGLRCFAPGLLAYLHDRKIIRYMQSTRFRIGIFRNGRHQLIGKKAKKTEGRNNYLIS